MLVGPRIKRKSRYKFGVFYLKHSREVFQSVSIFEDTNGLRKPLLRFSRTIEWESKKERVVCVLHNPAEGVNYHFGPTIRKLCDFFVSYESGRFGSYEVVNLYPYISSSRERARIRLTKESRLENLEFVKTALERASVIVVGWGKDVDLNLDNQRAILAELARYHNIKCFDYNKDLSPKHPAEPTFKISGLRDYSLPV